MLNYKELVREEREKAMRAMLLDTKVADETQESGLKKEEKSEAGKVKEEIRSEVEVELGLKLQNVGESEADMEKFRLKNSPAKDLFYIPNVISGEDCERLLAVVDSRKDNKSGKVQSESLSVWNTLDENWTSLKNRKLQQWGKHSKLITPPKSSDAEGIHTQFPKWLSKISDQLQHLFPQDKQANQCLINQYPPNGGIIHHTDGPAYANSVAVISLGGPMLLTFKPRLLAEEIGVRSSCASSSVLLESGSILVFRRDMYSSYLHGIEDGRFFDVLDEPQEPQKQQKLQKNMIGEDEEEEKVDEEEEEKEEEEEEEERGNKGDNGGEGVACVCLNRELVDPALLQQRDLHGRTRVERGHRTSLTFRHVPV